MSTVEGIEAEIRRKARRDAEVSRQLDVEAEKVKAVWLSHSPEDTGQYKASVQVKKRGDVDGFPARRVAATVWYAAFIEFGTKADTKQGSKLGLNTPTPAFAPRAKTAAEFGGDESPAGGYFPVDV